MFGFVSRTCRYPLIQKDKLLRENKLEEINVSVIGMSCHTVLQYRLLAARSTFGSGSHDDLAHAVTYRRKAIP
jgi:hypothetical protein